MSATVSSHTLNAVDGSHAAGIAVRLVNLTSGATVAESATDDGGRLTIAVADPDPAARYELVFATGAYWAGRVDPSHGARILDDVVLRFTMPDPSGRYHLPLILSPHGYSVWSSTEHG